MGSNIVVRSVQGAKYTHEVEAGTHQYFGDEPTDVGGADRGPTPYEFLLTALGT